MKRVQQDYCEFCANDSCDATRLHSITITAQRNHSYS